MNTKTKEGARNKVNPYFLRVPWNKGGLVNTGPGQRFESIIIEVGNKCAITRASCISILNLEIIT